jgi:ABC-type Na+ efflux pump permease subunit
MDIDLLDRRGRLVRLVVAATIGLAVTLGLLRLIGGVARKPNEDAISQVSPFLLGAAMFALFSYGALFAINAILKRRSER